MISNVTFTAKPDSLESTAVCVINKPRADVFKAYTNRELISKWWFDNENMRVEEMDVRAGGSWCFVQESPQGDFPFRGVYHRVETPQQDTASNQIITTWGFDAAPAVFLETVTFEDTADGGTKVTDQFVFQSVADREMMLTSGMENGTIPMFERLEKLL